MGDAEVGDLEHPVRRQEQVARLHVAVHETDGVRCAERVRRLGEQPDDGGGRQRPRCARDADSGCPSTSSITRNGDRVGERVLAVVVDAGDAGVRERRGVTGLGAEPAQQRRVAR